MIIPFVIVGIDAGCLDGDSIFSIGKVLFAE